MATTIDNYDLNVYNLYALRTKLVEDINRQYRLDQAAAVTTHTVVPTFQPLLTEIDLLLGVVPFINPWAYFFPPKKFRNARRSSFAFWRIAPSLGTFDEQEELEELIENIPVSSSEEKKEKHAIQACLKEVDKLNSMLRFITGRIGQFLQG